ncbi:MAG: flavin reductase family protein [Sulfolobales archaeon]|nr:flavin reductase family protein [Sulfolobales archaeon]MCX8209301.1 flavin reductase family protein [Sulfolobales archaeon]MDW8010438.1 flavin reductase family protein [Sulfolobales archaeon]
MYLLHPRPAYAVCSLASGVLDCLAASWITPVSRQPPILMVALAPRRATYALIRSSRKATVNVLEWGMLKSLHYLGSVSLSKNPDKMAASGVKVVVVDEYPKIEGALAVLYCDLRTHINMGDHDAVFLDVVRVEYGEAFTPKPRVRDYKYVLHVGGGEYTSNTDSVVSF